MGRGKFLLFTFSIGLLMDPSLDAASFCKAIVKAFAYRTPLTPILSQSGVTVKREVANCGTKKCVLLVDLPMIDLSKRQVSDASERFLSQAAADFKPCILKNKSDPWFSHSPSFNCHSFALRSHIPISPRDWVDGVKTEWTLDENPMDLILSEFFLPIAADFEVSSEFLNQTHQRLHLKTGDILVFISRFALKGKQIIHSMEIVKDGRDVLLRSKLGQGPIVLGSLNNHISQYEGRIHEMRIYRRRE